MNIQSVKALWARQNEATPEELEAAAKELQADHDKVTTMADLEKNFESMEKPDRQALYRKLEIEAQKYPMMVPSSTFLHAPYISLRNKMAFFRGVKFDANGQIIRDKAFLEGRKKLLLEKKADSENRIKNINAEVITIDKELEALNG